MRLGEDPIRRWAEGATNSDVRCCSVVAPNIQIQLPEVALGTLPVLTVTALFQQNSQETEDMVIQTAVQPDGIDPKSDLDNT